MPIVHIDLVEGRSNEQLRGLVKDVTKAISKNADVPEERIHIILNEMKKDNYSVGGTLKSDEK
ncbi:putative tautomerase [Companilactobacillus sp. RD055328]|uniref:2-hydroxymuconate tautomerase n=1 Tax=Companilactobacillus sp. RD055328 TaxID=2916634 RepID=UPI001FC7FEA4|nr:2-hydroxymuconate tautomerase [Companilactobacillus sp. RD055328]GKQ42669.1 putative tautomerase [Companilactobacillus sp. RD055328]